MAVKKKSTAKTAPRGSVPIDLGAPVAPVESFSEFVDGMASEVTRQIKIGLGYAATDEYPSTSEAFKAGFLAAIEAQGTLAAMMASGEREKRHPVWRSPKS